MSQLSVPLISFLVFSWFFIDILHPPIFFIFHSWIILVHNLCFWFGVIPLNAIGLLHLHSGFTPSRLEEPTGMWGIDPLSITYKASTYPLSYHTGPKAYVLTMNFVVIGIFGPSLAVFRAYSWYCAQGNSWGSSVDYRQSKKVKLYARSGPGKEIVCMCVLIMMMFIFLCKKTCFKNSGNLLEKNGW